MRRRAVGLWLRDGRNALYGCNLSAGIVAMLGSFATLLAAGGTFAMFLFRLFLRLEGRVDRLEG